MAKKSSKVRKKTSKSKAGSVRKKTVKKAVKKTSSGTVRKKAAKKKIAKKTVKKSTKKKTAKKKTISKTAGKTTTSRSAGKTTGKSASRKASAKSSASKATTRSRKKSASSGKSATVSASVPKGPRPSPLPWLNRATAPRKKVARKAKVRKFSAKERKEYREKLIDLREQVFEQIDFLATDNLSRSKSDKEMEFHSEEQGTENFERDFALNRVSLEQEMVFEIDEALSRLENNNFGVCEACGGGIELPRLKALPQTRMCVSCQSATEGGRRRYRPFDKGGSFGDEDVPSLRSNDDDD